MGLKQRSFKKIYLFIWLPWVFLAALRLTKSMWDLSSSIRDQNHVLCIAK